MLLYSVLMFVFSTLIILFGILIYNGKTSLIHAYHQNKVKDKKAYGKAFGKALFAAAAAPFISGIVGLFGASETIAVIAVIILNIGLIAGFACILIVQKKYNKGLF